MERNVDFFLKSNATENMQEVEVPGISKFQDSEGNNIPWIMKPMNMDTLTTIRNSCTTTKKKRGRTETDVDSDRLAYEMIVETVQYPNMRDEKLLSSYNVVDPVEVAKEILCSIGDFTKIMTQVNEINGIDDEEDLVEEAKN